MPKKRFRYGPVRRVGNTIMAALARVGIGPGYLHILTTRGQKSGRPHSHPVLVVIEGDDRWLVAPYGTVDWVHNALAAGQVILTRGRDRSAYRIERVEDIEAGRILKKYVRRAPLVLPYFEAGLRSPETEFAAEAGDHPVFRLRDPLPRADLYPPGV